MHDWRHDISFIGSREKVIRTVSHTFPKLGNGAMGSRFREQLTHWTDPAVFSLTNGKASYRLWWAAHEAYLLYMRNFLEGITKNKYNQGGLTLKDLKPDTFRATRRASCPSVSGQTSSHRGSNGSTKTLKLC